MKDWIDGALERDKWSIARLVSVFEDARPQAAEQRALALRLLSEHGRTREGVFHGITGTPGAGKSSLIAALAPRMVSDTGKSVAVLAVDPSSDVSGGALLGDRTRVRFPVSEKRLYFRSQSSDRSLGGLSRTTYQVCRLLGRLFDHVIVETVGIGQNEIEVQFVADRIYLILQPMGGDQIQFMKAGIMEVPDVFVINKSDERKAALRSFHALKAGLSLVRPDQVREPQILRTSVRTGEGIEELTGLLLSADPRESRHSAAAKEGYFFTAWVRDEFGRRGLGRLIRGTGQRNTQAAGDAWVKRCGNFDEAQLRFVLLTPWDSEE